MKNYLHEQSMTNDLGTWGWKAARADEADEQKSHIGIVGKVVICLVVITLWWFVLRGM